MIRTLPNTTSVVEKSRVEGDGREALVPITMTFATGDWGKPRPGIVLFPEIFGISDFILDTAHDLARLGYVVATPDLYHGNNAPSVARGDVRQAMKQALAITPETSAVDTEAAVAMLRAHPEVDNERLAAMGYCIGGLLSYASAARGPAQLRACVIFHANGLMGKSPHPAWRNDLLLELGPTDAPVRMFFGGKDDHISTDYVRTVDSQLEALGVDVETTIYEEAGHGFCNSQLPTFSAGAARDSWRAATNFLTESMADSTRS